MFTRENIDGSRDTLHATPRY